MRYFRDYEKERSNLGLGRKSFHFLSNLLRAAACVTATETNCAFGTENFFTPTVRVLDLNSALQQVAQRLNVNSRRRQPTV